MCIHDIYGCYSVAKTHIMLKLRVGVGDSDVGKTQIWAVADAYERSYVLLDFELFESHMLFCQSALGDRWVWVDIQRVIKATVTPTLDTQLRAYQPAIPYGYSSWAYQYHPQSLCWTAGHSIWPHPAPPHGYPGQEARRSANSAAALGHGWKQFSNPRIQKVTIERDPNQLYRQKTKCMADLVEKTLLTCLLKRSIL